MTNIDLSDRTEFQFVVEKEENQYLGQVSSLKSSVSDTIFAAYPRSHGRGTITLKKSNDGGITWSDSISVPESWHTSLQVPTLFETDCNNKKHLLMVTGLYPIRMSISDDDGKSWSELKTIGDFGGNVSFSDMIKLKNGNYMAFFHDDGRFINGGSDAAYTVKRIGDEKNFKIEVYHQLLKDDAQNEPTLIADCNCNYYDNNTQKSEIVYESRYKIVKNPVSSIYSTVSADGGLTWSQPNKILSSKSLFLAEPAVVYSPDKSQMLMLMRENYRCANSQISISNDEGLTWSDPFAAIDELTGDRHIIRKLSDGRLVIIFRDMHKSSEYYGDWVAWIGAYDDLIKGKKGQYKLRLKKNYSKTIGDCGYSGVVILDDDTIVATSYGCWNEKEQPYILTLRLNIGDLSV